MTEQKKVKAALQDGSIIECTLELVPGARWRLALAAPGPLGTYQGEGDDAFEALRDLRTMLERKDVRLLCAGARRDVFPSGMARSMSAGRKAYVTKLGSHATRGDVIDIFDDAEVALVGTVQEQDEFHDAWVRSLSSLSEDVVPYPGEIEEAKRYPNGRVYRIAGHFGSDDRVPPEAIVGAWRVDANGMIVGAFIKNAKYDPNRWPPGGTE